MLTGDTRSPYVDFNYYHDSYHGNLIKADVFQIVELEAEAYINAITFGRIQRLDVVPDCVKNAICAAAEAMHEYLNSRKSSVKSESNDGYSITYADAVGETECRGNMRSRAGSHLANTGLTYKGWSKKYDEQC